MPRGRIIMAVLLSPHHYVGRAGRLTKGRHIQEELSSDARNCDEGVVGRLVSSGRKEHSSCRLFLLREDVYAKPTRVREQYRF